MTLDFVVPGYLFFSESLVRGVNHVSDSSHFPRSSDEELFFVVRQFRLRQCAPRQSDDACKLKLKFNFKLTRHRY